MSRRFILLVAITLVAASTFVRAQAPKPVTQGVMLSTTSVIGAIDSGKRAAVLAGSYTRDDRVSPSERAAVEFAEVYAMDAQAITDDLARGVVAHFGEPGLVALIEALGFIDGRIRLARMLGPLFDRGTHHA